MINYINNLKSKPEHIRRRFAFLVASSFTFIVFMGWITTIQLGDTVKVADETDSNSKTQEIAVDTPVTTLSATAINAWNDVKSIFLGSNKAKFDNNLIEVLPGKR